MSKLPVTPHNVLPAPSQSWGGYWTFMTAAIVILLILYLASNSQLSKWLALFSYSAPQTPADIQGGGGGAPGGLLSGVGGSAAGAGADVLKKAQSGASTFQLMLNSFLGL